MAICEPGTVLECAVEPCHNPAEQEVTLVGYGPYPTLVIKFCPSCVTIYRQKMFDWLHPYEDAITRTHRIDGPGEFRTLPERRPTRSPYVMTGQVPIGETICRGIGIPEIEGEEFTSSLINIALDGKEIAHTLAHSEAKQVRYPDYLSAAIDRVSDELLDRLEADIRRIEAHPASSPEPEQHAPGWLPGDD